MSTDVPPSNPGGADAWMEKPEPTSFIISSMTAVMTTKTTCVATLPILSGAIAHITSNTAETSAKKRTIVPITPPGTASTPCMDLTSQPVSDSDPWPVTMVASTVTQSRYIVATIRAIPTAHTTYSEYLTTSERSIATPSLPSARSIFKWGQWLDVTSEAPIPM